MSMRPSFRCARIRPSPPLGANIVRSNALPGKAGLAGAAGPQAAVAFAHRPTARPGELDQLARQARREVGLARRVHRIDPLHLGFAELARAIALVQRVEYAALARRAVLDVGVACERRDRDAIATRRIDRHLAGDEGDAEIVDRNRLQLDEIERRLRITERPVARAAPVDNALHCRLLGVGALLAIRQADVVYAQ